jgi:tankyrase
MSSTKSLHELAQQGNIEALKTELSMCPGDVNNRNSRIKINGSNVFCTPLHAAVLGNQLGTCKFLIDEFQADAFLSTTEYNKHLPIHVAAINGFTEIVTMLIDYIMPVDVLNSYRETPLWLALQNERIETARALLQLGADPCHVGGPSNVPLINNICEMDKLKSLTFLVEECKVPINVVDSSGSTPLHKACQFGKDEMASYLVPNLTVDDINIVNVKGDTPLHTLCDRYGAGSEKIAQIILSASPNIVSMRNQKNGWTPLHYACSKQKIGLCTILLQHGADISILNNVIKY